MKMHNNLVLLITITVILLIPGFVSGDHEIRGDDKFVFELNRDMASSHRITIEFPPGKANHEFDIFIPTD